MHASCFHAFRGEISQKQSREMNPRTPLLTFYLGNPGNGLEFCLVDSLSVRASELVVSEEKGVFITGIVRRVGEARRGTEKLISRERLSDLGVA